MTRKHLAAAALGIVFAALGCGYRPLNDDVARDRSARFTVAGALPNAPYSDAAAAAEAGARAELARAGALATKASEESPTLSIELLRVDEEAAGIAMDPASGAPLARGLRVTVTGRARAWAAGGRSNLLRETGDVRASVVFSRGSGDAAASSAAVKDAARLAGRRLGERLARRILGLPDPGAE